MFNGAGATCVAAKALERNWIGIDLHPGYCEIARNRVEHEPVDPHKVLLEPVKVRGAENGSRLALFAESIEDEQRIIPLVPE